MEKTTLDLGSLEYKTFSPETQYIMPHIILYIKDMMETNN